MSVFAAADTAEAQVYRVAEVASLLGVHRKTIVRWAQRGDLPARRLGALWLFPRGPIDELIGRGAPAEAEEAAP
jgi:excisionase family DNA binding protein